ncbi:MAG TPA: type II toxin-antitoxin system VapC family toxin [Allosphingosinicella sp.]|nr:type II toxin-antitoxin system VapC family toxin [Allosphingosinicella sp.]HYG31186.1 type II toxin-antitoxin system VapC family toxin [Allosphingosinicella sp.]
MRLLLDTHTLLWAVEANTRLSRRAAEALNAASEKLVSSVTVYEICLKHRLGKLPGFAALVNQFERVLQETGCDVLPVTFAHAREAGLLSIEQKDPFDRLLIAQARIEGVPVVSNDKAFDAFGVERIW